MDTLGFEPRAFRMQKDVIPLHHVPACYYRPVIQRKGKKKLLLAHDPLRRTFVRLI